ncbi:GGDEF domain-containing protein, partial [Gracilibacillus oryzae]
SIFSLLVGSIFSNLPASFINRKKWLFSFLMAGVVTSMHYTGIAAATFEFVSDAVIQNGLKTNMKVMQWFIIFITFTIFIAVFFFIFYQKFIRKTMNLQDTTGIVLTDARYHILKANPSFYQIVDQLKLDIKMNQLHSNLPFDIKYMDAFEVREYEYQQCFIEVSKVIAQSDEEVQYLWYFRDISEKKEAEMLMHKMAYYNNVTNLPNRNLLENQIKEWKKKDQRNITCLYIQSHRLRFSMDSLGTYDGESFIRLLANKLKEVISDQDLIVHYENRTFLIFILDAKENQVLELVEKLLHQLTLPIQMKQRSISIAVNIGISNYPLHTNKIGSLVYLANLAMLESSQRSKNQFSIFEKSMLEQSNRKILLEDAMIPALKNQEFTLVYQPIFCVKTGEILNVETLIRWKSEKYGFISPAEFIPIAEENGFINKLGAWIVKEACLQWVEWKRQGYPLVRIAVNVSAIQLAHDQFIRTIEKIIEEAGMDPHYLELEITESSSLNYHHSLKDKLSKLSRLGIYLSLDDFGTGYSSFEHLKELPVNKLKIDRSFIYDLITDQNQQAILRSIIQLGHNLKMDVLMEGVEEEAEVNWLRRNQCDFIQGYYFSRPLSPDKLIEYITLQKHKTVNL